MTNLTLSEMKVPVLPDYITHCHSYCATVPVQYSSVQFSSRAQSFVAQQKKKRLKMTI